MASISICLFGKPEWEFNGKISPEKIRRKGDELKLRLYAIADALEKLSAQKWEHELALYDVFLTKGISKKAAEKELKKLSIKENACILEDEEDS
ncbi:MAG TPA: hypothetical protein VI977_01070 [archaeon]|nr:hypothetical protein [archaeon]